MRISLVGTVHEEAGLASISELCAILERITPDVIFLEMPPGAFDEHFEGTRRNLESTAVGRYRAMHHVALVPVDLPTPDAEFFRNRDDLYSTMQHRSFEHYQLMHWHTQHVWNHGFAYLNSEHCDKLYVAIHAVTLAAIEQLADRGLAEHYELWTNTKERREHHMMRSIEHYCGQCSFRTGAFLVGAAHRHPMMDLSLGHAGADSSVLQWDFDGFIEADARRRAASACTSSMKDASA
jgi:hypothetical protein